MSKLLDPISYMFYFSCISEHPNEALIKSSFKKIIQYSRNIIIPYIYEGGLKTFRHSMESYHQGELGNRLTFIGSTLFSSLSKTEEDLEMLLANLAEDQYYGFEIIGSDDEDLKPYFKNKTAYGKEYIKWFGVHRKPIPYEEYVNHKKELYDLLNCPSPDLNDVQILPIMLHGNSLFNIHLQRIPVFSTKNLPRPYELVFQPSIENETYFYYEMYVAIPRAIIGKNTDTLPLQQFWRKILLELGNAYSISTGKISMDTILDYQGIGFSCYENETIKNKKRYFSKYIPGYNWGMLINREQAKLISQGNFERFKDGFHSINILGNGNQYYQLTPDIRDVSLNKSIFLRNMFRPYLPPVQLSIKLDQFLPSYRLGVTPEEMIFDRNEFDRKDTIFRI